MKYRKTRERRRKYEHSNNSHAVLNMQHLDLQGVGLRHCMLSIICKLDKFQDKLNRHFLGKCTFSYTHEADKMPWFL